MKKIILILAIVGLIFTANAQDNVGIGTATPEASAKLDVVSTTQGFLPPRMTTTQRDAIVLPASGLIIYNTSEPCLQVNNGTPAAPDWNCLSTGTSSDIASEVASYSVLTQIGQEGDDPDDVNSVVTVGQMEDITGPAIVGLVPEYETYYQDYIDNNPDLFSSPATQAEVQAMVDAVNNQTILAQIGSEADNPDSVNSVVTIAQLELITGPEITDINPAYETYYQDYIDAFPDMFSEPATNTEVQAMIDAVNANVPILTQIGNDADDLGSASTITIAQLDTLGLDGVDPTKEQEYRDYIDTNPDAFSSPATYEEVQAMIDGFNVPSVTSATGRIWMDRNIGASQVATSRSDSASYGYYFQFGRAADGHEQDSSGRTTTKADTYEGTDTSTAWYGKYIDRNNSGGWTSAVYVDEWSVNGANNPCPSGYRVPTAQEWIDEIATWDAASAQGAYDSVLKLPSAGMRDENTGSYDSQGVQVELHSSTPNGDGTTGLGKSVKDGIVADYGVSRGPNLISVRCIKD